MKKLFFAVLLLLSFALTTSAFAATSDPTQPVNAPGAVGNYNDFGQQIRLDIYVKNTNANQFIVYYAKGYMATNGFQSYTVGVTPNYTDRQNQQAVRTEFVVPSMGWWTIKVYSVRADGVISTTAFTTNVNVIR